MFQKTRTPFPYLCHPDSDFFTIRSRHSLHSQFYLYRNGRMMNLNFEGIPHLERMVIEHIIIYRHNLSTGIFVLLSKQAVHR